MRWFFRAVGLIFLIFLGTMVAGYFSDERLTVERRITIDAVADDIYPYLNDLELAAQWTPWGASDGAAADPVYGATVDGAGARVMWRADDGVINSQNIIASQAPEFVQATLVLSGEPASVTYALLPSEGTDTVDVFINFEMNRGGFPYLQRLFKGGYAKGLERDFDAALMRLKTVVEAR